MSAPSNVSVDSSASRHVGCVKWFDNRKGFGFINNLSNNSEVFVHHTGLNSKENCFRTLFPGEYIEYHDFSNIINYKCYYNNNIKVGTATFYYKNGQIDNICNYENGKISGMRYWYYITKSLEYCNKLYDSNGALKKSFLYEMVLYPSNILTRVSLSNVVQK